MVIQGHFDEATSQLIREMWIRLKKAGLPSSQLDQEHIPHITFAAGKLDAPDSVKWEYLRDQAVLPLTFCALGTFSNQVGAIFLSPVFTPLLRALHERIDANVPFTEFASYYRPDQWYPHCTVGIGFSHEKIAQALIELRDIDFPITARLVSINLVKYPESEIISSTALDGKG